MEGRYKAMDVARYFLHKQEMTQKKLHKMLFYAYAWYLYQNNELNDLKVRLFTSENPNHGFQAWVHGPVFRELYPVYANNGFRPFYVLTDNSNVFNEEDKKFLDEIIKVYGKFDADKLENMSHTCCSWINARKGYEPYEACSKLLDDKDIYRDIEAI